MKQTRIRYIKNAFILVLRTMAANRKRCFFAITGIIVGIAAVTTLASLGYSSQRALADELEKMGTNMLIIESTRSSQNRGRQEVPLQTLTEKDVNVLQEEVGGIAAIAPVLLQPGEVKINDVVMQTDTFATLSPFMQILALEISQGRFFTDEEAGTAQKMIVLGHTVAQLLFNDGDPVGKTVNLDNTEFEVIGVFREKGLDGGGEDQDDLVVIPLAAARQQPGLQDQLTHIYLESAQAEIIPEMKEEIGQALRAAHQLEVDQPDHFNVLDQAQMLAARTDILGSLEELVNVLAVLILLAGGLGITAVQLISIRERAWEIGLHRAMGARKKDITKQFLLESAILGTAGGLAGACLGVLAPLALTSAYGLTPAIAWPILIISLLTSVMVGIAAGIYPALYASRLDPVVALRSA